MSEARLTDDATVVVKPPSQVTIPSVTAASTAEVRMSAVAELELAHDDIATIRRAREALHVFVRHHWPMSDGFARELRLCVEALDELLLRL